MHLDILLKNDCKGFRMMLKGVEQSLSLPSNIRTPELHSTMLIDRSIGSVGGLVGWLFG